MNNKKVIITFDYELFLGQNSGTAHKCIIEPTDIILKLLSKFNAKAIFFIDAVYLLKLKEVNHKDLILIKDQIRRIIKLGHNVELHIHPQWLDAYKIDNERWGFKSFNRYRLHSLEDKEIDILFKKSINLLEEIIQKEDKKYEISAFRAGGWSIQPFNAVKKHFIKNKILFDFSVNPGLYSNKDSSAYYDFRDAPHDLDCWKFEEDPCAPCKNGKFIEIPVSTLKVKKIDLWKNYYFYRKNEKEFGDGKSILIKKSKSSIFTKIVKVFNLLKTCYSALSIDGLSHKYFIKFFKKYDKKNKKYITVVLHPKKLSESGINNLEYLIKNYKTIGIKELKEELI